jgi:hypothetical protein
MVAGKRTRGKGPVQQTQKYRKMRGLSTLRGFALPHWGANGRVITRVITPVITPVITIDRRRGFPPPASA